MDFCINSSAQNTWKIDFVAKGEEIAFDLGMTLYIFEW